MYFLYDINNIIIYTILTFNHRLIFNVLFCFIKNNYNAIRNFQIYFLYINSDIVIFND